MTSRLFNPKNKFIMLAALFCSVLFSACTYGQYSPETLDATVQSVAATGIILTLTALPTATLAPTNTATATVEPSATIQSSPLPSDTATPSPTQQIFLPTWTPFGLSEPTDFVADKTNKDDKNAPVLLNNQSGEEIHFIIDSPIYVEYTFTKSFSLILNEATYHYRAWIGNHGPLSGTFSVTNGDKHILTFYKDKIHFATP